MNTSEKGLDLIKRFEGYREKAYMCPAGVWTVGYGHTKGVTASTKCDTVSAHKFLIADVGEAELAIANATSVKLSQFQFDALVSFVFNLGAGAFRKSTLLRKIDKKDFAGAANEFDKWVFAGGKKQKGLELRRAAEKELFLEG